MNDVLIMIKLNENNFTALLYEVTVHVNTKGTGFLFG